MLAEQNGSGRVGHGDPDAAGRSDEGRARAAEQVGNAGRAEAAGPHPQGHVRQSSIPTPAYGLSDVKAGTSTSTVDVRLDDLAGGAFAINVHKSADETEHVRRLRRHRHGRRTMDYDPLGHDKEADY